MNTTKIFRNYKKFLNRPDKSVNGVKQYFIDCQSPKYDYQADNATNTGCWCCLNCTDCTECIKCNNCHNCYNCAYCINCWDIENGEDAYATSGRKRKERTTR